MLLLLPEVPAVPIWIFQKSPLYMGKLDVEAATVLFIYKSILPYWAASLDEDMSFPV